MIEHKFIFKGSQFKLTSEDSITFLPYVLINGDWIQSHDELTKDSEAWSDDLKEMIKIIKTYGKKKKDQDKIKLYNIPEKYRTKLGNGVCTFRLDNSLRFKINEEGLILCKFINSAVAEKLERDFN